MMLNHKKRNVDDVHRVTIDLSTDEKPLLHYRDLTKGNPIAVRTDLITVVSATPVAKMQVVAGNMASSITSLMEDILHPGRYTSATDMVLPRESKPRRNYPNDGCVLLIYDINDSLVKRIPIRLLSRVRVYSMNNQMHKVTKVDVEISKLRDKIAQLEALGAAELESTDEYD